MHHGVEKAGELNLRLRKGKTMLKDKEYCKIETALNRDPHTFKVLENQWRLPEFEYLKDCLWYCQEKIDGMNIRVGWDAQTKMVYYGGKTDKAVIPPFLMVKLQELFPVEKVDRLYPDTSMLLYGEGCGPKIQKDGERYSKEPTFFLFDVQIKELFLERNNVRDIAEHLNLYVPVEHVISLSQAIYKTQEGFPSVFVGGLAEGLVCRPQVELQTRMGYRVITKIKHKDFNREPIGFVPKEKGGLPK